MLSFVNTDKRQYDLYKINSEDDKQFIRQYKLVYEPGSNKYPNMLKFIEDVSVAIPEFGDWYINTITTYKDSGFDYKILRDQLDNLKKYCGMYLDILSINFDNYVNRAKASKNSIFFDGEEIKKIILASAYLKVYYSIQREEEMRLSEKFHKETFQNLVKDLSDSTIIIKLHKIVSSKTFEYNHTDKYMWNYIKNLYCKTPDMHINHIFNFLVNNILVTCEITVNPIPYIISVIDESIKWILKSIYKDSIVYSDSIATQDVNSVAGKDNLETYAHNNTIGLLTILAYQALEELFDSCDNKDNKIEEFKSNIDSIKETSVFAEYFTYPILSKVLDIPYRHFLTLSAPTSYLMNVILYKITENTIIEQEFSALRRILLYYNVHKGIMKTTYKMKNINDFTKTFDNFCGFKNYTVPYDIYSSMIGKIIKNNYCDFINGNEITNFPTSKLENELILFYNKYFSNNLEDLFDDLREKIDRRI